MPYVIVILGIVLVVTALRGTTAMLGKQIATDTVAAGGFVWWFIAILIIGGLGYIKALRGLSDAFLALVIIALVVSNKGIFDQAQSAVEQIVADAQKGASHVGEASFGTQYGYSAGPAPQLNIPGMPSEIGSWRNNPQIFDVPR